MRDICFDIASLHAAYAEGADPRDVVLESLRRLEAANDPGIFLHVAPEDNLLRAAASLGAFDPDQRPLWGIPFAVKDNIDVAGMPTTAGCPAFAYMAEDDAFCVAVLRAAGAIPIGKTNLDQFATGLVGTRTPYPVPRNAIDPTIVPGGSSSGSAVAVARAIVSFALGTDTAGSGRVPAGLNNVVGLKPTLGAISTTGVVPACRTLDAVSIFALTVDDAHKVFRAASQFDPADAYARPVSTPSVGTPPPQFRVGVPSKTTRLFFGDDMQAEAFEQALVGLRTMQAAIKELDFTVFYDIANLLYDGPWIAERYVTVESLIREHPDSLHPVTRDVIQAASRLSATDAFRGFYALHQLKREARRLLDQVDMLCVPTVPKLYTVEEVQASPLETNVRLGTYTNFVNLLDLCGISVPVAPREDGLPGSMTLLAPSGHDHRVASIAAPLHCAFGDRLGATDFPVPAVPKRMQCSNPDEMKIAVVGAHMSGLPLNGDLTRLGGRFLCAGYTAPYYRLYALDCGSPARPGLVRDATGGTIALEVWALPQANIGQFLATIPPPLSLGTVTLQDGSQVTGFLCESAGLEGAIDITNLGGWRNHLSNQMDMAGR